MRPAARVPKTFAIDGILGFPGPGGDDCIGRLAGVAQVPVVAAQALMRLSCEGLHPFRGRLGPRVEGPRLAGRKAVQARGVAFGRPVKLQAAQKKLGFDRNCSGSILAASRPTGGGSARPGRLSSDEPCDRPVRRGPQGLQQVPSLFPGRVEHGPQRRVVPGSRLAAQASGDPLLHLEEAQRPLCLVVGRGNRGTPSRLSRSRRARLWPRRRFRRPRLPGGAGGGRAPCMAMPSATMPS